MTEVPDILDILSFAIGAGASDIHICAGLPPSIRLRGAIVPCYERPLSPANCKELIFGILSHAQRVILEEQKELDFSLQVEKLGRFRGNVHYSRTHIEASFRYIPSDVPAIEKLGHRPAVRRLAEADRGLVLVTGMTGSGKTTTIASLIKSIGDKRQAVIITIEDPIEFYLPSSRSIIKQREIGADTQSFTQALRHVLRQDPDVIMIGEMRDRESVRVALSAAETGHLVFATLHTNDAPQALDRLVDFFPGDEHEQILGQLASSLLGVVAQRLIPSEDGTRRVMASEFLAANSAVRACIRQHRFEQFVGLMETGASDGMFTFDEVLEELYLARHISKEEAINGARDRSRIEALRRAPREAESAR